MKIGQYNKLNVSRLVDFGAYLDAGDGSEILMPAKYISNPLSIGDEVDVFVYRDSEDRPVATTEHPYATVGEFAFLKVAQVNSIGAFLDWGLEAKNLLVPFREQRVKMQPGGVYLVYVYLDHTTQRVVASSKIEKFIGNVLPHYNVGDKVGALIYERTPIGYRCIVDNLHYGLIYFNEIFQSLALEQHVTAYVKNVRDDAKIDLTMSDRASARTDSLAERIYQAAKLAGGTLAVGDKSSPEEIQAMFSCSKRDFKQAVGHLYREHRIVPSPMSITICK